MNKGYLGHNLVKSGDFKQCGRFPKEDKKSRRFLDVTERERIKFPILPSSSSLSRLRRKRAPRKYVAGGLRRPWHELKRRRGAIKWTDGRRSDGRPVKPDSSITRGIHRVAFWQHIFEAWKALLAFGVATTICFSFGKELQSFELQHNSVQSVAHNTLVLCCTEEA